MHALRACKASANAVFSVKSRLSRDIPVQGQIYFARKVSGNKLEINNLNSQQDGYVDGKILF